MAQVPVAPLQVKALEFVIAIDHSQFDQLRRAHSWEKAIAFRQHRTKTKSVNRSEFFLFHSVNGKVVAAKFSSRVHLIFVWIRINCASFNHMNGIEQTSFAILSRITTKSLIVVRCKRAVAVWKIPIALHYKNININKKNNNHSKAQTVSQFQHEAVLRWNTSFIFNTCCYCDSRLLLLISFIYFLFWASISVPVFIWSISNGRNSIDCCVLDICFKYIEINLCIRLNTLFFFSFKMHSNDLYSR